MTGLNPRITALGVWEDIRAVFVKVASVTETLPVDETLPVVWDSISARGTVMGVGVVVDGLGIAESIDRESWSKPNFSFRAPAGTAMTWL